MKKLFKNFIEWCRGTRVYRNGVKVPFWRWPFNFSHPLNRDLVLWSTVGANGEWEHFDIQR